MKYGTKEDYLFLDKHEKKYAGETADRILKFMSGLNETLEGYQVSRLEHSLQSATKAFKNNESEEFISCEGELVFAKSQRLIIGKASAKLKNKASMELENLFGKFTATEIE